MKLYVLVKLTLQHRRPNGTFVENLKRGWHHLKWYKHFGHDVGTIKDSIANLTMYLKPDQREHVQRLRGGEELEPLNQVSDT